MEERAELIIDTEEIDDENILFLKPNYIKGARFCASNIFDYVSIKHCPTEKLNSGSLVGIFNSLKPGAQISIVVNQPISVMLEYDSKQIEANLKLVGFEDITYEERNSTDKKKGMGLIEGVLTAIKPVNKEKDIQIEIVKREYNYKNKNENKKEKENDKDDWASYRIPKKVEKVERIEKVEEVKEEPLSNRYKKGRFNNSSNNIEKNEKQEVIPPKKYNRFSKNVEEQKPKEDVIQQEVVIKEEKRVRPKRFGFGRTEVKEEKPQVYIKTEITETKGGNKPGDISTTKEIVIEKTTVIDKNTELENKKAGLRKRYGKH
jgi:hypothetical protein